MFNDVNDVLSDGQCNRLPIRTVSKLVGELVGHVLFYLDDLLLVFLGDT